MGTVSIQKKEYKGWKNCIEVSNGKIDLIATTDIGPRIMRFGFTGKDNEFYENESELGLAGNENYVFYGGHRLWHSPEDPKRTTVPDNNKIKWRKKKNGIILDQPTEPWTNIKKDIEITMSPDEAKVTLSHKLTNMGAWDVELSLWCVTMMAAGGKEIIPQVGKDTGLLPNRSVSLWPYTKMNDPRVYWGDKYITIQQDASAATAFKIGLPDEDGWAAYVNGDRLFVKQYQHYADEIYPDFGASYETYTNGAMLEMETLSPLVILGQGEYIEHTEIWTLFDGVKAPKDEKEMDALVKRYIKF